MSKRTSKSAKASGKRANISAPAGGKESTRAKDAAATKSLRPTPPSLSRTEIQRVRSAEVFAALGDETRLTLLARLNAGSGSSIQSLTEGGSLTRQAITKHLRVLERAGLVRCRRTGRSSDFTLLPQPLDRARRYLDEVSAKWDAALVRLKEFAEKPQ